MKLEKLILPFFALTSGFYAIHAEAFQVDQMIVVSDDRGNGIITLTNDEDSPLFVEALIDEVEIKNGDELVRKRYARDNLDNWKIALTHQKLVLKKGEEKDLGIRSLCHNTTCDNSKDLMFSLSFMPSKYREDDAQSSGVEINYGFAPVYIIPTTEPVFDYEIVNKGKQLEVINDSNTMIQLYIDSCTSEKVTQCQQKLSVMAGRHKTFNLVDTVQSDDLHVTVRSHDRSYSKEQIIPRSM
ncbi:hypothetical protein [Vibrio owensii]|uniref:hypothetical protein n=1 Tax=Vibrio owensii TaxID=696485 RepID=UPI003DA0F635